MEFARWQQFSISPSVLHWTACRRGRGRDHDAARDCASYAPVNLRTPVLPNFACTEFIVLDANALQARTEGRFGDMYVQYS